MQMLRETIAGLRGEAAPEERVRTEVDVEIDAYLPEAYVSDPDQRIAIYKRLAELGERSALDRLREELRDRFGRLPEPAVSLLRLKEIRILAEEAGVERLKVRGQEAVLRFADGREPGREAVQRLVRDVPARLAFQADGREGLRVQVRADDGSALGAVEALLRACLPSDTLIVSESVN